MRPERAGRIAFGLVLIAGSAVLAWNGAQSRRVYTPLHAWQILAVAWLGALAMYWIVSSVARLVPIRRTLRSAGLVVPTIGAALLLPLTLHMPIVLLLVGVRDFDRWCSLSIVTMWLTHLAFAAFAGMRAYRLANERPAMSPWKIYSLTVFVACVPFVILFALPPLAVAVTGLPIVPMLFAMERIARRDHEPALAFAIVSKHAEA